MEGLATLEIQFEQFRETFNLFAKRLDNPQSKQQHWLHNVYNSLDDVARMLQCGKKVLGIERIISQDDVSSIHTTAAARLHHQNPIQSQGPPLPDAPPQLVSPVTQASTERQPTPTQELDTQLYREPTSTTPSSLMPQPPTFLCNYEDIGEKLNEAKLEKYCSHPTAIDRGYFKLAVQELPALTVGAVKQPGKYHTTNFSCQKVSSGFIKSTQKVNKGNEKVIFPSFPLPETQKTCWSEHDMKDFWENTIQNPPNNMLYVIGDPLFEDIKLDSGERLRKTDLKGIGSQYIHQGFGLSCTAMHGEDAMFLSLNLHRTGEHKLWLFIDTAATEKLQHCMRQQFPKMEKCSQAVRHLSVLVAPSKLDEWGIPYSLHYTKPDEAIVTIKSLHQVVNLGHNTSFSINILLSSAPAIPKGYKFCSEQCGPHTIKEAHLRTLQGPLERTQYLLKRRKAGQDVMAAKKRRVTQEFTVPLKQTAVQDLTIATKRKALPTVLMQKAEPSKTLKIDIASFVKAISTKDAFQRLCSWIRAWRDKYKPWIEPYEGHRTLHLMRTIDSLEGKEEVVHILSRIHKVQLANEIDAQDRTNADTEELTKQIKLMGWENDKAHRAKIKEWIKQGRKWKKVCGSYKGLLSLIPPNRERGISGAMFRELSPSNIIQFHSLLDSAPFVKDLCQMGEIFETSACAHSATPQFKWESKDVTGLSMQQLVPLMATFPLIKENLYSEKYEWEELGFWPGEWPQDPTLPTSNNQCEICKEDKCHCIDTCLPQKTPQIVNEGPIGQGVRAIATYSKGQILGELVGELVPIDTYQNEWTMEFIRPDLSNQPVAQIYTGEMGNWVRMVNHSHIPCAEFRVMLISGRWRQMLVAIQDIEPDHKITASCGQVF